MKRQMFALALSAIFATEAARAQLDEAARPTPAKQAKQATSELERRAEDVEIMRRLLVQAIGGNQERPEQPALAPSGLPGTSLGWLQGLYGDRRGAWSTAIDLGGGRSQWSSPVASRRPQVLHARGFVAPNSQVIFALDVRVPGVWISSVSEPETAPADPADDWSRVERQVRGSESAPEPSERPAEGAAADASSAFLSAVRATQTHWLRCDPQLLAEVRGKVMEVIARHGRRIDGLSTVGTLTVALRFSAYAGTMAGAQEETRDASEMAAWLSVVGARQQAASRHENLVLQFSARDLAQLAQDPRPEGAEAVVVETRY